MEIKMTGMFAGSKAGHDKGDIYVIIREEPEYVYLVDGKLRTLDKPKKKNKKHIQIVKKPVEASFAENVRNGEIDDAEIRKVITQYKQTIYKTLQ